jgi:apolipoprotein N-acyltransferase
VVPSSPRGWWGLPAALVLLEAVRMRFPFGGFPIPGLALSQLDGPFILAAPWGGGLLVVGLSASAGTGVYALLALRGRQRMAPAAVVTALFVSGLLLAAVPTGTRTSGRVDAAVAQGGGPRGLRAVFSDSSAVTARQFEVSPKSAASAPQLLVWPEDVVTVTGPVDATAVASRLSALATALHTTLVVGVVENDGATKFRNAAVAWAPDGRILGRYEKVHRVPFGEYIPLRSLFQRVTDATTLVPRDAIAGRGPGILGTPAGPLGVLISYEVFFPDRARAAVEAGAQILLVPTNAASYTGKEVPAMEVAAARLRAAEFQRSLLQAAPTGYSAIINPDGTVAQRSGLGAAAYLQATVTLRTGRTFYSQAGDRAPIIAAIGLLLLAWTPAIRLRSQRLVKLRRRARQRSPETRT